MLSHLIGLEVEYFELGGVAGMAVAAALLPYRFGLGELPLELGGLAGETTALILPIISDKDF